MTRTWTRAEVERYAAGAINLYRELVEVHKLDEDHAQAAAVQETSEALSYDEVQATEAEVQS